MNKRLTGVFSLLLLLLSVLALPAKAESEEILDYKSAITVHTDASITVTETLVVNCLGRAIRHGIYRDFPTTYQDRCGNRYRVRFQVQSVTRDGVPERFFIERRSNGERIYIGDENNYVTYGVHTYAITYQTRRQLGFFQDYDELYWNVTGNGWAFPIRHVSALVKYPDGVPSERIRVTAYTGVYGSKEQAYTATFDPEKRILFSTTRPLRVSEGLTIVVAWPKGFVVEPDTMTRIDEFLMDNVAYIVIVLGFLVVLIYYLIIWDRYGRDPARGTVVPVYFPPSNLSPAAVRYLRKMDFDNKVLTSAVIDLAVRGGINIFHDGERYAIRKKPMDVQGMPPEEAAIYYALPYDGSLLTLRSENYEDVQRMANACRNVLADQYEGSYFIQNKGFLTTGIVASALVCLGTFLCNYNAISAALIMVPIVVFAVILLKLTRRLQSTVSYLAMGLAVVIGLVKLINLVKLVGIHNLVDQIPLLVALVLFAGLNTVFYFLLKSPTLIGRKVLDQIEGFRMFLATAEKERLNALYPGGRTPQLFEQYLPYALALDVELDWAERFSDVLAQAGVGEQRYRPGWYCGADWSPYHSMEFTRSLAGSFSKAIVSSAVPPGSSSGFSGSGGFSGGGGGGGGGGGW